jgi:nitrogen regulatory protein PII
MPSLVTAIIKPHRLDEVRQSLQDAGIVGMTVSEVQGYGRQGGKTETFRGSEYQVDFVPKLKLELLVASADVDRAVETIAASASTGRIGDGKIWAVDCSAAVRIRTGELGDDAV